MTAATQGRPLNRLYKNRRRGLLFGVCAGFSDYFGFDLTVVRVLTVIAGFFSFPLVPIAYLVLGFLLPCRPYEGAGEDYAADPVRREVRADPHEILSSIRYRARDLDSRLARLEKYVTSNRFQLDQEFRKLKD